MGLTLFIVRYGGTPAQKIRNKVRKDAFVIYYHWNWTIYLALYAIHSFTFIRKRFHAKKPSLHNTCWKVFPILFHAKKIMCWGDPEHLHYPTMFQVLGNHDYGGVCYIKVGCAAKLLWIEKTRLGFGILRPTMYGVLLIHTGYHPSHVHSMSFPKCRFYRSSVLVFFPCGFM